VAVWSFGYALELASAEQAVKLFWARTQYAGIVSVPVAWLLFARRYAGGGRRPRRRNLALLAIVPLTTLLLAWTNDLHHLIWSEIELGTSGPLSVLEMTYGLWFWIHSTYSYALMVFGTFLVFQYVLHSPRLYRRQARALLVGAFMPWLGNIISLLGLLGLIPLRGLDLTPFGFTLTGLACWWSLFRFGLLDIVPIARDAIIESMRDAVLVLDAQGRIVDLNPSAQRTIGLTAASVVGQSASEALDGLLDPAMGGANITEESQEIRMGEGDAQRVYDVRTLPLFDRRRQLNGWLIALRNITPRKRVEEEVRALKEFNEGIIQSMAEGIAVQSAEGILTFVNPAAARLLGYRPEELVGQHWTLVVPLDQQAMIKAADQRRLQGQSDHYEVELLCKDLSRLPVLVHGSPRLDAETGRFAGTLAVFTDISERVQAEEQVRASLREKEVLLQEVHHRVKNNLQVVSSLLDMQSLAVESPDAIEVLQDSRNRVKTMSLVHEELYQAPDLARIDVGQYVRGIVSHLTTISEHAAKRVQCEVEVRDVALDLDTAIPCGLIINELVTNSLKYAFRAEEDQSPEGEDEDRRIWITLSAGDEASEDEASVTLIIRDNGVGLPPEVDLMESRSLGLHLVRILVQQLRGTINVDRSAGTAFQIVFPTG
jgi:PAS domain S-box-containing protein